MENFKLCCICALKLLMASDKGRDYVEIQFEPLNSEEIIASVNDSATGAIATFIGTTRDHFNGKKVVQLEYEGYMPMAKKELGKICAEIRTQWPGAMHISIVHRLGVVPVKESSVIIAVSSAHRRESLEAVAFAIDALKERVPIWKLEIYENDDRVWKENAEWKSGRRVMVPN